MAATMLDDARTVWWMFLVSGVISLFFGLALIFFNDESLELIGFVIGLWILFFGIIRFLVSLFGGDSDGRWLMAIVGVLGIVLGIVVIRNPTETIAIIALIVGIFWIISGLIDVWRGITNGELSERMWVIMGGLIAIAAGALLVFWPEVSVKVLALIAGIFLLIDAVIQIITAFRIKAAV